LYCIIVRAEGGIVATGRAPDVDELVNMNDTTAATHDTDIIADTELHIVCCASRIKRRIFSQIYDRDSYRTA